jgi:hypothetical protein
MNKNLLTVLGCSGSLALILFSVNPANASTIPSQDTDIKETRQIEVDAEITQDNDLSSLPDINSDEVGEIAILTLGCDCGGCRNLAIQTIQQKELVPR